MDFKQRLIEAIARTGLTDGGVAERLADAGYPEPSHDLIFRWRNGRSLPPIDDIPAIAAGLGVDPVWLTTGRMDLGTLSPNEAMIVTVIRSLRLPLDEAIRRISTPSRDGPLDRPADEPSIEPGVTYNVPPARPSARPGRTRSG
jgi:hypothetical protein